MATQEGVDLPSSYLVGRISGLPPSDRDSNTRSDWESTRLNSATSVSSVSRSDVVEDDNQDDGNANYLANIHNLLIPQSTQSSFDQITAGFGHQFSTNPAPNVDATPNIPVNRILPYGFIPRSGNTSVESMAVEEEDEAVADVDTQVDSASHLRFRPHRDSGLGMSQNRSGPVVDTQAGLAPSGPYSASSTLSQDGSRSSDAPQSRD